MRAMIVLHAPLVPFSKIVCLRGRLSLFIKILFFISSSIFKQTKQNVHYQDCYLRGTTPSNCKNLDGKPTKCSFACLLHFLMTCLHSVGQTLQKNSFCILNHDVILVHCAFPSLFMILNQSLQIPCVKKIWQDLTS